MNKNTKKYDAPCFSLSIVDMISLDMAAKRMNIMKNEQFLEKTNVEIKNDENTFTIGIPKEKVPMINTLLTKDVFEEIEKQNQYKKINIILEGQLSPYEKVLETAEELFEISKNKKSDKREVIPFNGEVYFVKKALMKMNLFQVALSGTIRAWERKEIDEADIMLTATGVAIECERKENGLTLEKMIAKMEYVTYRIEIDFEEKNYKIFEVTAQLEHSNPKNYKPWEGQMKEVLLAQKTFLEAKKAYSNDILSASMIEAPMKFAEEFKKVQMKNGDLDEEKLVKLMRETIVEAFEENVLQPISFVLGNNLIEKKVEKKRVLQKPKNNKKGKKTKTTFKSIVEEKYIYKKEDAKKIFDEAIKNVEKMKERREVEYTKPEWAVKPHLRKLKNGKIVEIPGQLRKRKAKSTVENGKTLVLRKNDIEKMQCNNSRN